MAQRRTDWLFVHQGFPGQFVHAARHLAAAGHNVVAMAQSGAGPLDGVRTVHYRRPRQGGEPHPYPVAYARSVRNGEAVAALAEKLKRQGFDPRLMVGHSGWGEILFLKDVWPDRPLLGYFEFYWRLAGGDIGFDPEFPGRADAAAYYRTRNAIDLLSLEAVDRGHTPTRFQRSTYPKRYHGDIAVVHEGVDTAALRPNPSTRVWLDDHLLRPGDEVITYSARSLEPHRGFHVFMRALPSILRRRPQARVLIVGHGNACYSLAPANHRSYAEQFMAEIAGEVDRSRIHFLGPLPDERYRAVLRVSAVHVYFTYPFVLSWSLIEAMSTGCLVIGSRTAPVEEVIRDGQNGLLVDFFDHDGLADRICHVLAKPERHRRLRAAARETAVKRFDCHSVCLPALLRLYRRLTAPAAA